MSEPLPTGLLELLRKPSPCFVTTLMPDGSPQLTQTWVTTDGDNVVINIVEGSQKDRNLSRDRASLSTSSTRTRSFATTPYAAES